MSDCTGIEKICQQTIRLCQLGGLSQQKNCEHLPTQGGDTLVRLLAKMHRVHKEDLQSSDDSFLTTTILVYARTTNSNVEMAIPTIPTQTMMASPRRCGFSRFTT
jgi:hypothetical protein